MAHGMFKTNACTGFLERFLSQRERHVMCTQLSEYGHVLCVLVLQGYLKTGKQDVKRGATMQALDQLGVCLFFRHLAGPEPSEPKAR